MKKVFFALVLMCAAMFGMTSCTVVSLDIITSVYQGKIDGLDAVSVSAEVLRIYRSEIAKAQGAVVEGESIILRAQKDTKKAEDGALTGANSAKELALAKTYTITPIIMFDGSESYDVKIAEGSKDDCTFSIEVVVGLTEKIEVVTHYYKIVK